MQNLKPMSLFVFVIAYVFKSKEQVNLTHIPTCDNFFDKDKVTRWGRVCAERIA